jgi:hypothetical protein
MLDCLVATPLATDAPKWTDVATAAGTVGAVIVAIGLALLAPWLAERAAKARGTPGAGTCEGSGGTRLPDRRDAGCR